MPDAAHADVLIDWRDYGLWRQPQLSNFLQKRIGILGPMQRLAPHQTILGWGRKRSGLRATRLAQKNGSQQLLLEDGFLRSVEPGVSTTPFSVVTDDLGVYYDATQPSRLEHLIHCALDEAEEIRARNIVDLWRQQRVSKYNHLRGYKGDLPNAYILVVDQTFGDASIRYGMATTESFQTMLHAALDSRQPHQKVLLKTHPEVLSGRKKGHFDLNNLAQDPNIVILADNVHPCRLIESADTIYTVTSQMGLEGLIWGKAVHTFGMPFYAGWGLTQDALEAPERRQAVPLEQLLHAALIEYPTYLDPETSEICAPERIIEHLGLQRQQRTRFSSKLTVVGVSRRKRPIMRKFFQGHQVSFQQTYPKGITDHNVVIWGGRATPPEALQESSIIRVEDGFIRSVGLGAALVQPRSWVMDQRGMYFDATRPSDLEEILQNHEFSEEDLQRAQNLQQMLLASQVTKYNVGSHKWTRPATDRKVIVAPGQVEDDASIRYGAPTIHSNIALLQAVRERNPDAYLIYKPHPDVEAHLRNRGKGESHAAQFCDEVMQGVDIATVYDQIDEVHVMTSLAGFEALLRTRPVTCYGQPFYAGWGLTTDIESIPRRTTKRTLDELVAAALLIYPTYISHRSGQYTTAERALAEIIQQRKQGGDRAARMSATGMLMRLLRPLLYR